MEINSGDVSGYLGTIFQLMIIWGMYDQVKLIRMKRSADQLSMPKQWLTLGACVCYFYYGAYYLNLVILIPQIPATIMMVILIYYTYRYRGPIDPVPGK